MVRIGCHWAEIGSTTPENTAPCFLEEQMAGNGST